MTTRDEGPYMGDDGDIWVPRTVPWRRARAVASDGLGFDSWGNTYPKYVGKDAADLLGFTRDCPCDEVCEDRPRDEYGDLLPDGAHPCRVPAWHFVETERSR